MEFIAREERQRLGALLDTRSQAEVMAMIPQFSYAETDNFVPAPQQVPSDLGVLMFNMERGVHLPEIRDFLRDSPDIQPFDIILANEMDDGCARSGNKNTARELASAFGLNYAWGLEFIELVDAGSDKSYHGNAVFSRWPIRRAGVIRLPEQYNWYFDRQKRIGGRLAVFAELDIGGRPLGVVSIHLENRTSGEGRRIQLDHILKTVKTELAGMPVILGGDLNTNTFDGSKVDEVKAAESQEGRRRCIEQVFDYEACLPLARAAGCRIVPDDRSVTCRGVPSNVLLTRRKPIPSGGFLPLRLDWILLQQSQPVASRVVPTATEYFTWAKPGTALAAYQGKELSDHNAVWCLCRPEW